MSKMRGQDFLRGTDGRQSRLINATAFVTVAIIVVIVLGLVFVKPLFSKPAGLPVAVDVPYLGPGITDKSKVILRGAEVGTVTAVEKTPEGMTRLRLLLDRGSVDDVTDSVGVDFRPQNYFGIAAVNLEVGQGGARLTSGRVLNRVDSVADYTMSTMLEKGSYAVNGSLTETMVQSLDKAVRYTDGLTPLIQTGIDVADRVAQVQRHLPDQLLARWNDIMEVMPAFSQQAVGALYIIFDTKFNQTAGGFKVDDSMMDRSAAGLDLAARNLYGKAGHLLASHQSELLPGSKAVQAAVSVLPHLLANGTAVGSLSTLIDRYNSAFSRGPGGPVLNLRLVLDDFPALAGPLSATRPTAPAGGQR